MIFNIQNVILEYGYYLKKLNLVLKMLIIIVMRNLMNFKKNILNIQDVIIYQIIMKYWEYHQILQMKK